MVSGFKGEIISPQRANRSSMRKDVVMGRYKNPIYQRDIDETLAKWHLSKYAKVLSIEGDNPLCGDQLRLCFALNERNGVCVVEETAYEGYGCSLCIASVEVLFDQIQGIPVEEALALCEKDIRETLGGIDVGRSRARCLSLGITLMKKILAEDTPANTPFG